MLLFALALLQQQPAAPPPPKPQSLIARVEVSPPNAEVPVGGTLQLSAKAYDQDGKALDSAKVRWFGNGDGGSVSEEGIVKAGYRGALRVSAVASLQGSRPAVGQSYVTIVPTPPTRVEVTPWVTKVLAGTRLSLSGTAYSAQNDLTKQPVSFSSSNPKVVSVTPDGRLHAVAVGTATVTAKSGSATTPISIQVLANTATRISLAPATTTVRTGDVVRFKADVRNSSNREVAGVPVRWSIDGGSGVAQIDAEGAFVAETPGKYTVTSTVGNLSADAVVTVSARRAGRPMEVVGRVPIKFSAAEVWAHPSGKCVYLSTIADRVYAVDVSTSGSPRIVDSMMTDSRIVNDVMTTEDGKFGVFSREGASNRKNGIVVFDASDPCHPKAISEYTETVSGGVHSSFVYQGHVYLTDDATGSMRVIDIRDPRNPREVGRWQTEQTEEGRYVHDIDVKDGLAYLSYWNDGLIILDIGKGIKGGSPEKPVLVSQLKYDLPELYARVDQMYGLGARGTHTAWRHKNYVFIGDEVYNSKMPSGLKDGNNLTFGRLQVVDVSDIEKPRIVAWYEPTDGGVHNVWVEGDTLYMGNYQGGARAVDVSGELKGDLLRQGREISWMLTADDQGNRPRATFAWGAVVKDGNIYVPDINTGLWILRLEPKLGPATP